MLITGRNEVVAKVIFLHLFVILFSGRGGSASMHAGIPTPPDQTPHPPRDQADPPGPGSSPYPPDQTPPLGPGRPPRPGRHAPRERLQHTVYERPVRILLECILVPKCVLFIHLSMPNDIQDSEIFGVNIYYKLYYFTLSDSVNNTFCLLKFQNLT